VFFHNEQQQRTAHETIDALNKSGAFRAPIVTHVEPAAAFYPAEDYHQNYFAAHPTQSYCAAVIRPKIDNFAPSFRTISTSN